MLASLLILPDGSPNEDFLEAIAELVPSKQRLGLAADLIDLVTEWMEKHPSPRQLEKLADEVREVIRDACCHCQRTHHD